MQWIREDARDLASKRGLANEKSGAWRENEHTEWRPSSILELPEMNPHIEAIHSVIGFVKDGNEVNETVLHRFG